MQASHRVGMIETQACREISGCARGHVWLCRNACVVGSTPADTAETAASPGRLAGCRSEAARSFSQRVQMRNGAHGGAPNACERLTAGFTLLLGVLVALQARHAAATAALGADGALALLLLAAPPRSLPCRMAVGR